VRSLSMDCRGLSGRQPMMGMGAQKQAHRHRFWIGENEYFVALALEEALSRRVTK
jgi:hypothetical protein